MLVLPTNTANPFEMITCTVNRMIGYTWQVIPFSGPTPTSQSLDMNLKKEGEEGLKSVELSPGGLGWKQNNCKEKVCETDRENEWGGDLKKPG